MQPRQIRETERPLLPRVVNCINDRMLKPIEKSQPRKAEIREARSQDSELLVRPA